MKFTKECLIKPFEKICKIPCINCESDTDHQVLTGVCKVIPVPDSPERWKHEALILQCTKCDEIAFSIQETHFDDSCMSSSSLRDEILPKRQSFFIPDVTREKGIEDILKERIDDAGIYHLYYQTKMAIYADYPILAGAGMRALLENLLERIWPKRENLEEKIDRLQERQTSQDVIDALHQIRIIGNNAVHKNEYPTREEFVAYMTMLNCLVSNFIDFVQNINSILRCPLFTKSINLPLQRSTFKAKPY